LVPTLSYLCSWRRMRRAAHEALAKRAVQNYHPIQMKEATILASSLLSSSTGEKLAKQFHRVAASTILSIVYDYPTLESIDDPTLKKIEDYVLRLSHAAMPGSYFVNIFPWMLHIPERFVVLSIISLRTLTDDPNKDSRNGSGRAFDNSPRIPPCSKDFSAVSKSTSCVIVLCGTPGHK